MCYILYIIYICYILCMYVCKYSYNILMLYIIYNIYIYISIIYTYNV